MSKELDLIKEIKSRQDEAHKDWHLTKEALEEKVSALENRKGVAELEEKIERITKSIADQMESIQKLEATKNVAINVKKDSPKGYGSLEYKEASDLFFRTGDDESAKRIISNMERKELSVNNDPSGGFFVMPEVDQDVAKRVFETSPIRQIATVKSISTDAYEKRVRTTRLTSGGWVGEQQGRPVTDAGQWSNIRIPTHEHYAQPSMTEKLLDDASINVESEIIEEAQQVFTDEENTAFVSGDGVARPRGFLSYEPWTANEVYEFNKIDQINSGNASAFTADGIIDLQNSLKEVYQSNATFVTKRQSFAEIIKLKDNENNYLFNRSLDMNVGRPFSLLGASVMFASDMPDVAANALALAYGDFRRGYCIVDRIGMRILRDPYSAKPSVLFYTTKRVGGGVIDFDAIKIQKISA